MNHISKMNDKKKNSKKRLKLLNSYQENIVLIKKEDTITVEYFFSKLRYEVKKQFYLHETF